MPANRSHLGTWNPTPFITGGHHVSPESIESFYVPTDIQDCAEYLSEADPRIAAYRWSGSDELVRELAVDLASEIYVEGKDIVSALHKHLEASEAPPLLQDLEHDRALALRAATREVAWRKAAREGKTFKPSHLVLITTVNKNQASTQTKPADSPRLVG